MLAPEMIRFRALLLDGQPRLAFGPVLIPGSKPPRVRVTLIPVANAASSGKLRPDPETHELAWDEYQKLAVVLYSFLRFERRANENGTG